MKKTCSLCKMEKHLTDFNKSKSGKFGVHHYCKKCNSIHKKKKYKYNLEKQIKNVYNTSLENIIIMYHSQNGNCKICNKHFEVHEISKRTGLHIDHCHKTNKIRGLLCSNCNTSIGKFNEDINIMTNAIKYLESFAYLS